MKSKDLPILVGKKRKANASKTKSLSEIDTISNNNNIFFVNTPRDVKTIKGPFSIDFIIQIPAGSKINPNDIFKQKYISNKEKKFCLEIAFKNNGTPLSYLRTVNVSFPFDIVDIKSGSKYIEYFVIANGPGKRRKVISAQTDTNPFL